MSASYPAAQIVRCPLCHDGARPQHIGNGVIVCESCGSSFRVVHAELGKTGLKLGKLVDAAVRWQ